MSYIKVVKAVGDVKRFSDIVSVFSRGGFYFLAKKMGISHCLSWKCRIECYWRGDLCPEEDLPRRLREILVELGPTFVKFGQIMSTRPDFFPEEFIKELKSLQDDVPSFSFEDVQRIIEGELNKPMGSIFKSFEETPVAAASLCQVHRAQLKDGKRVAVKVQRPGIEDVIEKDMRIIGYVAALMEKYVPETRNFRPMMAAKEFANYTKKELDFVLEGRNAERFRYNFKEERGVKIPAIYWDYTTKRVLTMEFVEGVKMGDVESMKKIKVDHKALAQNCAKACSEPILSHGFFHADPHPGNVWVVEGSRVCYLDFGMVGVVSRDMKRKMLLFFKAMIDKEVDEGIGHLLRITEQLPGAQIDEFKREAADLIYSLYVDSSKKETMAKTFYKVVASGAKRGIVFPANMILMAKALMTGETMCLMTHKDFDLIENSKPVIEKIYKDEFGIKRIAADVQHSIPELLELYERLPAAGLKFVEKLERGELDINLNVKEGGKLVIARK